MWRLCLIIRDVIKTCDDTIYNLSSYVCDWSLGAHKIMHLVSSLKSGVTFTKNTQRMLKNLKMSFLYKLISLKFKICMKMFKIITGVTQTIRISIIFSLARSTGLMLLYLTL